MKIRLALVAALVLLLTGCGPEDTYQPSTPIDASVDNGMPEIPPYSSCDEAPGPVGYGEPGFNDRLDDNGDGVICAGEPT